MEFSDLARSSQKIEWRTATGLKSGALSHEFLNSDGVLWRKNKAMGVMKHGF